MFENSNIKHKILSKATKYSKDVLFKRFIDSFYSYIPIDDKKSYDIGQFSDISILMYNEFSIRESGKHKVNLYSCNKPSVHISNNNDDQNNVVITIINDNMPFIVDSVTELLNKRGYKVNHIINALLSTKRDNKGKVIEINAKNSPYNESVVYINITSLNDKDTLTKLNNDINKILTHVRVVISDWPPMLTKLSETIEWFEPKDPLATQTNNFLEWLSNDNFTFIGYREYALNKNLKIQTSRKEILGMNSLESSEFNNSIIEDVFKSNQFLCRKEGVFIGKIREVSKVHRYSSLDYVCIIKKEKTTFRARVFLGLFVTRLDYQSVTSIPLIKSKTEAVITKAGFDYKSFNGKELFNIIETLPRDELFQLTEDELFLMTMMILSSLKNPRLLFFVRENKCKSFLNLLVFFPKARVTADIIDKIHQVIKKNIQGKFIHSILRFSSMGLVYVYISMKVKDNRDLSIDIPRIEQELDFKTKQWNEHLDLYLKKGFGLTHDANQLFTYYKNAFPANYHALYSLSNAVHDIGCIERLSKEQNVFSLYQERRCKRNQFKLKIYHYSGHSLSF